LSRKAVDALVTAAVLAAGVPEQEAEEDPPSKATRRLGSWPQALFHL